MRGSTRVVVGHLLPCLRSTVLGPHPSFFLPILTMSVRVVARIRPLLKAEIERDVIVEAAGEGGEGKTVVRIPNPKNEAEAYSFQFNSVYDQDATQAQIFDNEGETDG